MSEYTDKKGLRAAIRKEPAEDTPREAYADWLRENGGAAGERWASYINTQCAMEHRDADDPVRDSEDLRSRELFAMAADTICAHPAGAHNRARMGFKRGMLNHLHYDRPANLRPHPTDAPLIARNNTDAKLVQQEPVTSLHIGGSTGTSADFVTIEQLRAANDRRLLDHVETLAFGITADLRHMVNLLGILPRLKHLKLGIADVNEETARELTKMPLESLEVRVDSQDSPVSAVLRALLRALGRGPGLTHHLEDLTIRVPSSIPGDRDDLTDMLGKMKKLRRLSIADSPGVTVAHVAAAPAMQKQLEELTFTSQMRDIPAELPSLAQLSKLKHLNVTLEPIGGGTGQRAAFQSFITNDIVKRTLRSLDVDVTNLEPDDLALLADCPNLRHLHLRGENEKIDEMMDSLTQCPTLQKQLRSLHIVVQPLAIDEPLVTQLARLEGLRRLSFGYCNATDTGIKMLAGDARFGNLTDLGFHAALLNKKHHALLARSKTLTHLCELTFDERGLDGLLSGTCQDADHFMREFTTCNKNKRQSLPCLVNVHTASPGGTQEIVIADQAAIQLPTDDNFPPPNEFRGSARPPEPPADDPGARRGGRKPAVKKTDHDRHGPGGSANPQVAR